MSHTYIPASTLEPEKRAAAPKPADGPRTPNFINDVAAGKVELPTIPRVVQQVIAAVQDPDVDARKLGELLSQDPILSAKVLRLANSSFFGGQRSMASIDAAVALIGTQALGRLVLAGGVSSSFGAVPGIDLPTFWRDSLVAATAAHKLAARLGAEGEEAYVCGLLHGTGHLILCKTYPDIADFVFTGYAVARGAELAPIEAENFGIDHRQGRRPLDRDDRLSPGGGRHHPQRRRAAPGRPPARSTCRCAAPARWRRRSRARTRPLSPGRRCRRRCRRATAASAASPTPRSTSSTKRCGKPSRRSDGGVSAGAPADAKKRVRDALR